MGRKVGSFINPDTKENDWLDVSTVNLLPITPSYINVFKDPKEVIISFELSSNEEIKMIVFTAKCEYNKKIISSPSTFDEETFATMLAEAVYNDNSSDNIPLIVEAKNAAIKEIAEKLLKDGYIVDNCIFSGIGFVQSDGMQIMTIDKISINTYQNGTADIRLYNCIGNITLKNISANIVFYSDEHKIEIDRFVVKEDNSGIIKDYVLTVSNIAVSEMNENYVYERMELDKEDNDSVEMFIESRTKLLNYMKEDETDNDFEDRFADLL